jgi:hypothetical protein
MGKDGCHPGLRTFESIVEEPLRVEPLAMLYSAIFTCKTLE